MPTVKADDTIVEVAAVMAHERVPAGRGARRERT